MNCIANMLSPSINGSFIMQCPMAIFVKPHNFGNLHFYHYFYGNSQKKTSQGLQTAKIVIQPYFFVSYVKEGELVKKTQNNLLNVIPKSMLKYIILRVLEK